MDNQIETILENHNLLIKDKKINSNKITTIFTDCFNTIVLRSISDDDLIWLWTQKVGQSFEIEPSIIFNCIKKIKTKLGVDNWLHTHEGEALLKDSLFLLAKNLQVEVPNLDIDRFVTDSMALYSQTEMQNQKVNVEMVEVLKELKQKDKKIYLVSDFYCGKEVIVDWLKNLDLLDIFDDIFVSCDYNKSKSTGKLYKHILKTLNLKGSEVLMFGDNSHADFNMAKKNKINAVLIKSKTIQNDSNNIILKKHGNNYITYLDCFDEYGKDFNFSNHAFPLFLFTKRLYQELKKENVKDVFFLSREGQFLKKLFDIYVDDLKKKGIDSNFNTHYLYASRNSVLNASFNSLDNEDFYCLFRSSNSMCVKKFLLTLGFSDSQLQEVKNSYSFDMDKRIKNFSKSKAFAELKKNDVFRNIFEQNSAKQRDALKVYLDSFKVDFKKDGFYIVDIGWKGTMQDLFQKFFDNKVVIKGYFVGSCKKTNSYKYGLLYDRNNKKQYGNTVHRHTIYNYEQICRANHNRCDGYTVINGEPEVVFDLKLNDAKIYHEVSEPLQNQILEKFRLLANLDYYNLSNIDVVATKMFYKLIKNKSDKDWHWLDRSQNTHHDNFGDVRYPFKSFCYILRKIGFGFLDIMFLLTQKKCCRWKKYSTKISYLKNDKNNNKYLKKV